MTRILCNAFSLSMVPKGVSIASVGVERVSLALARERLGTEFLSAVGHATTARVLETLLGVSVPVNRVSVTVEPGDLLVVAQFTGTRLPEGATTLPEGAELEFLCVRLQVFATGQPFDVSS